MQSTKPLTPKALEAFKSQLWRIPFVDRACILSASIIADRRNTIAACLGLVECASRLAPHLHTDQRYHLAERLRSVADRIELVPAFEEDTAC